MFSLNSTIRAAAVGAFALVGSAASAAVVNLGFAFDRSGSINANEFALQRDGLAAALALIPVGGVNQYRVSVVSFASTVSTVVAVTRIDSAAALAGVIAAVSATSNGSGSTAIGSAIAALTANFTGSLGYDIDDTTVFNVSTDGSSNTGTDPSAAASAASAAGVDALSFEAIGAGANTTALLALAFPGSPILVSDAAGLPTDILSNSFVFQVADFDDYRAAIGAKVTKVIDDTGGGTPVVPLPAGLPLLIGGIAMLGVLRARRNRAKA